MSCSRSKEVHLRISLLVDGFVRNQFFSMQSCLMIHFIISTFYWINDQFLLPVDSQQIEIINGKLVKVATINNIITKKPIYRWSIIKCLPNVINLNDTSIRKYIWSIKYCHDLDFGSICFGIVVDHNSCYKHHSEKTSIWDYDEYYAVSSRGLVFNSTVSLVTRCNDTSFNNPQNIIHFCLDLESRNITIRPDNGYITHDLATNIKFRGGDQFLFIVLIPILKVTEIEMIDFRTEHYN